MTDDHYSRHTAWGQLHCIPLPSRIGGHGQREEKIATHDTPVQLVSTRSLHECQNFYVRLGLTSSEVDDFPAVTVSLDRALVWPA